MARGEGATRSIVLDSGALSALGRQEVRVTAHLEAVIARWGRVVVPAVVLVEATTADGVRDAATTLRLQRCVVVSCGEQTARRAAALRFRVGGGGLAVDAVVVATAEHFGAAVLTTDPDLGRLADDTDVRVLAIADLN